ncbi:hypothetical protein WICMUC_005606 [Wickerhamomyces mucosus]|uniref:ATPase V1 complex subunit H C-terminal domain-containing protein n=1 Tax=Wickerhamomyces mucosus TaxID=1378264 RepID=A0A9P8P7A3_9ASCO|nr:hypothetical protein WICMUC_005606 [Wickerhamomyces mucosus]
MAYRQFPLESTYLEDYRNGIRSKSLPWDAFARSQILSEDAAQKLNALKTIDSISLKINTVTASDSSKVYADILIDLLVKDLPTERVDVKKYALVTITDLSQSDDFLKALVNSSQFEKVTQILIDNLESTDEVLKLISAYALVYTSIQNEIVKKISTQQVLIIFQNFIKLLDSSKKELKFLSVEFLVELLSIKSYRSVFLSRHEEFGYLLFENLNTSPSIISDTEEVQFQYKLLLSILLLSFNSASNSKDLKEFSENYSKYFEKLITIVKVTIKEKIVRVAIAIFINLTSSWETNSIAKNNIKKLILQDNFHPILTNLKERKWTDEELIEDLERLSVSFQEVSSQLSSFDEYLQELQSKSFKNSPVHNKESFFIDHLVKFQESNYKLLKELLNLLSDEIVAKNSTNYVYILRDISKIIKLDSNAIEVIVNENKKLDIMKLLNDKNSQVKYEALIVTQLLVSNSFK